MGGAARAAPYEKGTETHIVRTAQSHRAPAARAAPYEKGTETGRLGRVFAEMRRRARGPL